MSDDEKPFEPTPQRIAKARREGNVARSSEFPANVAFAAAAGAVGAVVPLCAAFARAGLRRAASGHAPASDAVALVVTALIPLGCAAAAGTVAAAVQSGGVPFNAVALKLERLDPLEGCKRILSRETLAHAVRATAAFALAAGATISTVVAAASQMSVATSVQGVAATAWQAVGRLAFSACGVGAVFAVAEYAIAHRGWLRKLRMSFEDRKRESKEQEGDPSTRARRRGMHRSFLHGALSSVKDAAFVVVNPVHVAVALEYRPPEVAVPRILVRAADGAALRVRVLARAHDVAVVENVALARALYRDCRIGEPIAQAHYVAVAEVVAALLRSGALE
ncbi:MAG TPA: EscU/YscU/HrcU family type III secretion system export apparatus switch protein [Candidatus Baltobacteraceae bacterium]|nr:EscU/YscU/HrcU family type III secretion system export apparatus switch protein [Candidatus Baltobacteraceae bacterium]